MSDRGHTFHIRTVCAKTEVYRPTPLFWEPLRSTAFKGRTEESVLIFPSPCHPTIFLNRSTCIY